MVFSREISKEQNTNLQVACKLNFFFFFFSKHHIYSNCRRNNNQIMLETRIMDLIATDGMV
jgi:hypothetical protein